MSGLRFCSECLNLLHPEEDQGRLVFKCKSCKYQETVSDQTSMQENKIYQRDFQESVNEALIDPDFCLDPSMPREKIICPSCGYDEAVYIIDRDPQDRCLLKIYICGQNDRFKSTCGRSFSKEDSLRDMNNIKNRISDYYEQILVVFFFGRKVYRILFEKKGDVKRP